MSSTNRGGERSPADFYATPAWATYHAVDVLTEYLLSAPYEQRGPEWLALGGLGLAPSTVDPSMPAIRILEPCAGEGAIMRAANALLFKKRSRLFQSWTAIELEPHGEALNKIVLAGDAISNSMTKCNFFDFAKSTLGRRDKQPGWAYDLVIMNPPFRLALEFVQECLKLAPVVMALERLNFFGSEDRGEFMRASTPSAFVMPNRVSFISPEIKPGSVDSIEYAWFVWGGGLDGIVRVMPVVPKEFRKPVKEFELSPRPEAWVEFMRAGEKGKAV